MPNFHMSSDEAAKLVDYFAAASGAEFPYEYRPQQRASYLAQREPASARIRSAEAMNIVVNGTYCVKCHAVADFTPQGDPYTFGPNLADVYRRLRPTFTRDWIANPVRILPYTGMPKNIPYHPTDPAQDGVSEALFPGNSIEQLNGVVDLLMNFDAYARGADVGDAAGRGVGGRRRGRRQPPAPAQRRRREDAADEPTRRTTPKPTQDDAEVDPQNADATAATSHVEATRRTTMKTAKYPAALPVASRVALLAVGRQPRRRRRMGRRSRASSSTRARSKNEPIVSSTRTSSSAASTSRSTRRSSLGEDGALQNVFVYLYVARGKKVEIHPDYKPAAEPKVLDNKGCRFEPHAMTVWTAEPFEIHNSDPASATTPTVSARGEHRVQRDGAQRRAAQARSSTKTEPMPGDDHVQHPSVDERLRPDSRQSRTWPCRARTASFEIKNVPAGKQEFVFWHEAKGYLRDLTVGKREGRSQGPGRSSRFPRARRSTWARSR